MTVFALLLLGLWVESSIPCENVVGWFGGWEGQYAGLTIISLYGRGGSKLRGCGYASSWMGCIEGETGGEVDEVDPMLLGRLIRPPKEPSIFLEAKSAKDEP